MVTIKDTPMNDFNEENITCHFFYNRTGFLCYCIHHTEIKLYVAALQFHFLD